MKLKRSSLVIPVSITIHLIIINGVLFLMTPDTYLQWPNAMYYTFSWLLITSALDFYPTKRKEDFFTTHFVVYENESKNYRFKIRTPHFNYKKNFKEEDFYTLIDSSKSLRVELVYDDSGETFTFTKCK